jgi:hypothetical protein
MSSSHTPIPASSLASIDIEEFKRRAHAERSEALARMLIAGAGWLRRTIREAGAAAQLSEAPSPYRTPRPRTGGC